MASETKILEALFGPSIPTEKAALLPEIMGHIRAIDDLLQGKPRQRARPRISDPAISGPINRRIVELYAEHGKDWPQIAATVCQEFNVTISPDACRGRHKDAVARQEAYAALSGSAIQAGQYTTPPDVMQEISEPVRTSPEAKVQGRANYDDGNIICRDGAERQEAGAALRSAARLEDVQLPATFGQLIPRDAPVDPVVDPKPGKQVAQGPDDPQIEAIKAEAIKLFHEGQDVKAIAKKLGVRWQWVLGVLPPVGAPEPNSPASPDSSPKKEAAPLSESEIDAELIRLQDSGMSSKEIREAMLHKGVDFGLVELRDRLKALARKALQDRKAAKAAGDLEIPANGNRAELDAVMWRLWDHGKGKTPDEISDILCSNGYSYGTAAVVRRLRQQGAEL